LQMGTFRRGAEAKVQGWVGKKLERRQKTEKNRGKVLGENPFPRRHTGVEERDHAKKRKH